MLAALRFPRCEAPKDEGMSASESPRPSPSAPDRSIVARCRTAGGVLVLLAAGAAPAADADPLPTGPLPGAYQGQVYNADNLDPVLTVFFRDAGNRWRGTYAVGEDEGFEAGTLDECRWDADYLLRCRWTDKYGSGVVRMLFAADYRSFRGFWGTQSNDTFLPWDGYLADEGDDADGTEP